ncbi:MAG TPA: hypothetical protein VGJ75_19775, partial [Dongiaceae bacterium]
MKTLTLLTVCSALSLHSLAFAEVKVVIEHSSNDQAIPAFKFKNVPPPSRSDAATSAKFIIVDGQRDNNGGDLEKLHDGQLPREEDQPSANFFFAAGPAGGRIQIDLGAVTSIKQINTYSWHSDTRAPQVYRLYASAGDADTFQAQPKKETAPESCGWQLIAKVDTRPHAGPVGGQYGVSIADSADLIGKYRYLLFDIDRTEDRDAFGNTFYSEIDVVDPNAPQVAAAAADTKPITNSFATDDGKYHFTIDATTAPDLMDWAD